MSTVLLFTATVNPPVLNPSNGTPEQRAAEYLDAIAFNVQRARTAGTSIQFAVLENSGIAIPALQTLCAELRIDYIACAACTPSAFRGKGHEEAKLIDAYFTERPDLPADTLIIKITGRLKIHNIAAIIELCERSGADVFVMARSQTHYCDTRVFCFKESFWRCMQHFTDLIDDQAGRYIEIVMPLGIRLASVRGLRARYINPTITGRSASMQTTYKMTFLRYLKAPLELWAKRRFYRLSLR